MDQPLSHRSPVARVSHADAFDPRAAGGPPAPPHPRVGAPHDWVDAPIQAADPDESIIDWKWGDPISPNVIAVGGAVVFALLGAVVGTAFQL